MGKHNRNKNRHEDPTPRVEMTPQAPDAEETATEQSETLTPEEQDEEASVETVVAQAMSTPPTPPPPVEEPKAEEPAPPVPTKNKVFKIPKERPEADSFLPSRLSPMQKCVMSPQQLHTAPGLKLLELFKEYEKAMSVKTNDRNENVKRTKMLSALVQQACPYKLRNAQVGKDLVMIFFDQLMKGWGTIYTDNTVFRLDYSLGNPAAIDKMDMFVEAMIQLVEAATGQSERIAFDNERLGKVIDSPAVMIAIQNLRLGIEKSILQRKNR